MADDWRLFREWLRDDGDVEEYVADLSRDGYSPPGCAGIARTSPRTANSTPRVTPTDHRADARDVELG